MSAEILNSDVNKILDYFLIADSEMENKEKILKNIDNELDLSNEFPSTTKSNDDLNVDLNNDNNKESKSDDEFVDVVDDDNQEEKKEKVEQTTDEEVQKSMEILSLEPNDNEKQEEEGDKKLEKENNNEGILFL